MRGGGGSGLAGPQGTTCTLSPSRFLKDRAESAGGLEGRIPGVFGSCPPGHLASNLGLPAQGRPGHVSQPRGAPPTQALVGFLPTSGPPGPHRAGVGEGFSHTQPSPLQPSQVPGEVQAPRRGRQSCSRGRGRTPRPRPEHVARSPRTFPKVTLSVPRRPARASHLDRGQGPGGCARGGGGVGGAGCLHFRSSPSLLSTCCCEGPAGAGRVSGRRGWGSLRGPSPRRPCPPLAPRTCAALRDQLAGPLGDGVHGAGGPPARALARTHALPCPALRPGSLSAGAQGAAPLTSGRARRGGGRAATRPRPLKGPRVWAVLAAEAGPLGDWLGPQ